MPNAYRYLFKAKGKHLLLYSLVVDVERIVLAATGNVIFISGQSDKVLLINVALVRAQARGFLRAP